MTFNHTLSLPKSNKKKTVADRVVKISAGKYKHTFTSIQVKCCYLPKSLV